MVFSSQPKRKLSEDVSYCISPEAIVHGIERDAKSKKTLIPDALSFIKQYNEMENPASILHHQVAVLADTNDHDVIIEVVMALYNRLNRKKFQDKELIEICAELFKKHLDSVVKDEDTRVLILANIAAAQKQN